MEIIKNPKSLYQLRASKAFPILIRQALIKKTITYSDLALEIGMPNARNLNYPLGHIGELLIEAEKSLSLTIPPLQCLVVNKQTRLPGEGIGWFLDRNKILFSRVKYNKLKNKEKRKIVKIATDEIFNYDKWKKIANCFGFELPDSLTQNNTMFGRGGESEIHKNLKNYVLKNPKLFGFQADGEPEFKIDSGDSIDVFFQNKTKVLAVEVKTIKSTKEDFKRGIYQCLKYKYILEKQLGYENDTRKVDTILVTNCNIPKETISLKNAHGIKHMKLFPK